MKDLLQRARVVVRNSNMKISRRRLPDYAKTLHQKACSTCSTIICLHLTNQIIGLWRFRWRCRRQVLNSLTTLRRAHTQVKWLTVKEKKLIKITWECPSSSMVMASVLLFHASFSYWSESFVDVISLSWLMSDNAWLKNITPSLCLWSSLPWTGQTQTLHSRILPFLRQTKNHLQS